MINQKFKITLNTKNIVTEKPDKDTEEGIQLTRKISYNLRDVKELSFEEVVNKIMNGHVWCPATFEGTTRKNNNWKSQQIFALDFDSGVSPYTIRDILAEYKIVPNFFYYSFSHKEEHPKFRAVIFLDEEVKDLSIRKNIQEGLMLICNECDKQCSDSSRMFYPAKYNSKPFIIADEINNFEYVYAICCQAIIAKDNNKTRKVSKSYTPSEENPYKGKKPKNFDWEKLYNTVRIFRDFIDGKPCSYEHTFGIATNMINIEGGAKLMEETMLKHNRNGLTDEYGNPFYNNNKFAAITNIQRYDNYAPKTLDKFSPYEEDLEHTNFISAVTWSRGLIETTNTQQKITLMKAEINFKEELQKTLEAEAGVHLLKLSTGLGKTAQLETIQNAVIAFPTNKLKNEVSLRMKVEHLVTPDLPEFSEEIKDKINDFYKSGLIYYANKFIAEIASNKNKKFSQEDSSFAKDYLDALEACKNTDKTVLTTHEKALFTEFKHNTIIFDEDVMQKLIPIKSVRISELQKYFTLDIRDRMNCSKDVKLLHDFLATIIGNIFYDMPIINVNMKDLSEEVLKNNLKDDIINIFNAKYVYKDKFDADLIYYIQKKTLPQNKKYIIMSATASEFVYKKYFGDELNVIDITNIELKGELIQNTKYSYSKTSLEKKIDEVVELVGDLPVITFSTLKHKFKNPVEEMHFGNCSGYDTLNGKDIAVVGTFHLNDYAYILYAKALDLKVYSTSDCTMEQKLIERNGYKFQFNTYDNLELQELQLSLIESEIIQAVGRARLLRNDCKVYLYSNLPLKETTKFIN